LEKYQEFDMPLYQHILTAVDLGDNGAMVLQQAAALAQLCDAELTVLHVVNFSTPPDVDPVIPTMDTIEQQLIAAARKRLDELLEREALTNGVAAIVNSGRPKVEIMRIAAREKVDLIVVGAHGHHGIAGLLGSTADRVVDRATCSVLVVR
jgi:universal stress protein A